MDGFRKACLEGERVFGTFVAIPHPVAVEVVAASGFDFLCIDCEHGQIGRETVENLVRAADGHRVPTLVRVPGHGAENIAAALDSGARGVLVPRVSTPAEAAQAVRAARFPPAGARGVGPGRAAGYGYRIPDYLARANEEIVVAVQVETAEGLDCAAEIAAVEGVDCVFVGPGDLGVSLNAVGRGGAEQLADAVGAILEAANQAGKVAGMFCGNPEDAARWAAKGASFFMLGADSMFLGGAASHGVKAARDACES